MSTLVILATPDVALADAWERQLPAGKVGIRLSAQSFSSGTAPGFSAVVLLDAVMEERLPGSLGRYPTIYVGEPRSLPFEQARISGRAKVYLSYEESTTRLREVLPLVEELAEKQSLVEMLTDKARRGEPLRAAARPVQQDSAELWDFLEGAVENLDSRERLIGEFRRASRHLLRASHVVFFTREADGFRADRGTSFFPIDDPLVAFFETHPAIVDAGAWDLAADPVAELAVRNRLALWGARMLAPVHDNGRMLGLVAFGVRDDGQPYDDSDHKRAIFFARLLRNFFTKSAQYSRLHHLASQASIGAKYLPGTLVLGPDEQPPRHLPIVVRDLIGQARRSRQVCHAAPGAHQPFRASAGLVAETGGVWAFWQEASAEVHDEAVREHERRRNILRELALTLSHELSNSLVSLAAFSHVSKNREPTAALVETVKADVAKLQALNDHLAMMQRLHEIEPEDVDIRTLVQTVGLSLGIRVEVGPEPVVLRANHALLEFAVRALVQTVGENRPDHGLRDVALKLRSTGSGPELTALLSIKGRKLELEGVLPEPTDGAVPNQGRLAVFIAKEILRLHEGEIHAGPGMEGTEILFSLRNLSAFETRQPAAKPDAAQIEIPWVRTGEDTALGSQEIGA